MTDRDTRALELLAAITTAEVVTRPTLIRSALEEIDMLGCTIREQRVLIRRLSDLLVEALPAVPDGGLLARRIRDELPTNGEERG